MLTFPNLGSQLLVRDIGLLGLRAALVLSLDSDVSLQSLAECGLGNDFTHQEFNLYPRAVLALPLRPNTLAEHELQ